MLYIISIFIILYLIKKLYDLLNLNLNNLIGYHQDDYLFEQSNDEFNNHLLLVCDYENEYYFDDYSRDGENGDDYYYEHFDYNFINKFDKYLTKYFTINKN